MLSKESLQEITRLSQSQIVEIDGHKFQQTAGNLYPVVVKEREVIKCFSVSQLINLIKLRVKESNLVVNILDYDLVHLTGENLNKNLHIDLIGSSNFRGVFKPFKFEEQMSQEQFIIALGTKFVPSYELTELCKVVSSVRSEKVQTSDDDGISQVAATKAGVHLSSTAVVKNMWDLKTYVTFPELEQPIIPYMLRLHQRDDEMPKFALYECDGGQWKVELTIAVRKWIVNQLKIELMNDLEKVTVL